MLTANHKHVLGAGIARSLSWNEDNGLKPDRAGNNDGDPDSEIGPESSKGMR